MHSQDGLRRFRPVGQLIDYFARLVTFTPNARAYLVGTFLMGITHGAVWVHMNLYYRALGLGEESIGRLLAAQSFGTVLIALPAAWFIDRFAARTVFTVSAIAYSLAVGAQLLVPNPWGLMVCAALTGGAFTIHWVTAAPFFMRNSNREERIYLFGFAHAIETTATILAAVGVGWASRGLGGHWGSELVGLRIALLIAVLLSLLAIWPFLRIQSLPAESSPARSWRDYLVARDPRLLGKLLLPSALVGAGAGLVIPFLNLYFRDRFGQDPLQIGSYFGVSQFFTVVGFLAGPIVARKIGLISTVVLTELLSIPFFLVLALTDSLGAAVLAFWMRGALMNMNHPLQTNFAMEVVSADQQAVTNSLRMLVWNLSWMISTQVGGWIIERRGFTLPMLTTIGLYLIASIVTFAFWKDYRGLGRAGTGNSLAT